MANAPGQLRRHEMERVIREGGSVLMPDGRAVTAIVDLPPDPDQPAPKGKAPRPARAAGKVRRRRPR
jgi:hypothetical protein